MKKIEELIRRYDQVTGDEEADIYIKAKLKMINSLFEEIKGSEDRIYMEEIVAKFAEIMECQQGVISSLITEIAAEAGYGPMLHGWIAHPGESWDPEEVLDDERTKKLPSFLPPEGGFQTDNQVKKAFTNYLTYHVNRKTKAGKDRPFSVHTIYDYSSRVKVLMESVYKEWKEGNQDSGIQLSEQAIQAGCPFLNAYNNVYVLKQYVKSKEQELLDISMGLREPAPEGERTPLDNPRNLQNSSAALMRFEEFKSKVQEAAV